MKHKVVILFSVIDPSGETRTLVGLDGCLPNTYVRPGESPQQACGRIFPGRILSLEWLRTTAPSRSTPKGEEVATTTHFFAVRQAWKIVDDSAFWRTGEPEKHETGVA